MSYVPPDKAMLYETARKQGGPILAMPIYLLYLFGHRIGWAWGSVQSWFSIHGWVWRWTLLLLVVYFVGKWMGFWGK